MNRHQKAAFRPGEKRVRRDDVAYYLELARSPDPEERLEAAAHLCPCHVRTGSERVQQTIYELMQDVDARVRRAAWHTLEDGGCPVDPQLDVIFEHAIHHERDKRVRRFVQMFAVPRLREKAQIAAQRAERSPFAERGKCDFCGESNRRVHQEFDTEIGTGPGRSSRRFAMICETCASSSS